MKVLSKKNMIITVVIAFVGVILVIGTFAVAESGKKISSDLWLSHFVGDEVVVTFISALPGIERTVKAKLMDAEIPGIVLKFGKDETFFSYSYIIAVEPAPR
jgi:hypothetical protein